MNKIEAVRNLRKIKAPFEKTLSTYESFEYCEALDIAICCLINSFLDDEKLNKN